MLSTAHYALLLVFVLLWLHLGALAGRTCVVQIHVRGAYFRTFNDSSILDVLQEFLQRVGLNDFQIRRIREHSLLL